MPPGQPQLYVRYVDGSNASIPVPSRRHEDGLYEILPYHEFDYEDDSILFEFGPGDIVAAEPHRFSEGLSEQLACRLVRQGDVRNLYKGMFFTIVSGNPSFEYLVAQFGEEKVRQIKSEVAKMEWVYPAISDWINTNEERLNDT
jgi:hypothetical protein